MATAQQAFPRGPAGRPVSAFSPAKGRVSHNGQWGWGGQSRGAGLQHGRVTWSPLQRIDKLVVLGRLWGTHWSWEVGVSKESLEDAGTSSKKPSVPPYSQPPPRQTI